MKAFGLTKSEIDRTKAALTKVFPKESNTKVYLFGSRSSGHHKPYSDVDLAIESKDKGLDDKVRELRELLDDSDLPFKFDIVRMDKVVPEYRAETGADLGGSLVGLQGNYRANRSDRD